MSEPPTRRAGSGRSGSDGRRVTAAGFTRVGRTASRFAIARQVPPHLATRFWARCPRNGTNVTNPRTPTRLPAARRRQQLLDVALGVFAERGFHPTSMNDLAEAAGVTKPVLYQHFGSKRELYLELLDDVGTRLRTAI